MYDRSIITKTGQLWKLKVGFLAVVLAGISLMVGLNSLSKGPESVIWILAGIVLGFGSLIFNALSIKCPKCSARWYWMAISGKASDRLLFWLLGLSECPKCSYGHDLEP